MKKIDFKNLNYKKLIKDFLIILSGNLLLAFSISFCFVNYKGSLVSNITIDDAGNVTSIVKQEFNGILSGGTSGLSLILRNLFFTGASGANVVETIITVVTWGFFLLGVIFLGKKFTIQTLLSTILYPIFIYIFKIPFFDALHLQMNDFNPIICSILGGLCMGVGCGVIYRIGGSTGGFDVPGLIINKYTKIKLSYIYFVTDSILVILAFVANFEFYEIVIGIISVLSYTTAVEFSQRVGNEAYFCDIISDKWEEINREILALDRGTTIVDVRGGFTGKDRKLIKTMVGKSQYMNVIEIVKRIDPNAFMSMTMTRDVFGEGYLDITNFSNK